MAVKNIDFNVADQISDRLVPNEHCFFGTTDEFLVQKTGHL